jgi:hypothetical protein
VGCISSLVAIWKSPSVEAWLLRSCIGFCVGCGAYWHIPYPTGQRGNVSKNHLPTILSGIGFSLAVGVGTAEDSAGQGKGQIDAKLAALPR